jgi:hypothetical protein
MNTTVETANRYVKMLSYVNDDVKLLIINKLSESLLDKNKKKRPSIHDSFGAWKDGRSADEIIADIRNSRVLGTRHIVSFDD